LQPLYLPEPQKFPASARRFASGDVGDTLRADMLGMELARGDRAALPGTKRLGFPAPGQSDLTTEHHNAGFPIMGVFGVHHVRLEPTVKDPVTVAPQLGFEFALVHHKPPAIRSSGLIHDDIFPYFSLSPIR
jgi:hypothetical protein